ncbi:transmembrane protein 225B [Petaurus breviceps papuanus]|uniref:transmembrane protein 225B n=1 Tax=Petaurus breviceps papuanus TaxID=3040969 RepID=UPI0036DE7D6F
MEIKAHILEDKLSLNISSPSLTSLYCKQIQYHITKRNLLNLRFMAVILTTLSWVIMLMVCLQPKWVTLEHSNMQLWENITLNFALWDNCVQCLPTNKPPVYLILSRGIMFLNLVFTSLLIISMMCSFKRIFSRISRIDFIFSIANYISGLALFLCVVTFGLQVLEIFVKKGHTFHFKWPFYLSSFGILNFIVAGTICLNSHKNSWNISYLHPNNLLTPSKKHLCGNLWRQSSTSVIPQKKTISSIIMNKEVSITSTL